MTSDTISIADLRAEAKALRARADAIDTHIDALVAIMGQMQPAGARQPSRVVQKASQGPTASRASTAVFKGKKPGTMNLSWRENFARIRDVSEGGAFPIDIAQAVVAEREGKEPKRSSLVRHFKSYIEHGYLTQDREGGYRLTPKLLDLISAVSPDAGSIRNENEAPNGSAAGASDAEGAATPSNESQAPERMFG